MRPPRTHQEPRRDESHPETSSSSDLQLEIGPSLREEVERLPHIEREAAKLFRAEGFALEGSGTERSYRAGTGPEGFELTGLGRERSGPERSGPEGSGPEGTGRRVLASLATDTASQHTGLSLEFLMDAHAAGRLFVARVGAASQVVGFAAMIRVDGAPHLHELDVLPSWSRRGIGRRLLLHVARCASEAGDSRLTLLTYRDVPWNAPFYRSAGFVELSASERGPELEALRLEEGTKGLDLERRVAMALALS